MLFSVSVTLKVNKTNSMMPNLHRADCPEEKCVFVAGKCIFCLLTNSLSDCCYTASYQQLRPHDAFFCWLSYSKHLRRMDIRGVGRNVTQPPQFRMLMEESFPITSSPGHEKPSAFSAVLLLCPVDISDTSPTCQVNAARRSSLQSYLDIFL